MLEGREVPDEIPLRYRRPMEIEMDQIRREVAKEWGVPEEALAKRRAADENKAAIYLARKLMRLGGREVGRRSASRRPKSAMSSVRLMTRHPCRLPALLKGFGDGCREPSTCCALSHPCPLPGVAQPFRLGGIGLHEVPELVNRGFRKYCRHSLRRETSSGEPRPNMFNLCRPQFV